MKLELLCVGLELSPRFTKKGGSVHSPPAAMQKRGDVGTCCCMSGVGSPLDGRCLLGVGLGWQDLHGEGMGMGISLHHFLYFLAFELCK